MIINSVTITLEDSIQQSNKIYNSPEIIIERKYQRFFSSFIFMFTSPAAFLLDSYRVTTLKADEDKTHSIKGTNVVTFDKHNKKYDFNFGHEWEFLGSNNKLISVSDYRDKVLSLDAKVESHLKEGDIINAREYNNKLREAKEEHAWVLKEYDEISSVYKNAVNNMNKEIQEIERR